MVLRRVAAVGLVAIAAAGLRSSSRADPPAPTPKAPAVPTIVVSRLGDGDVTTIGAALAKVARGGRIVVREGRYRGGFEVTQPVEIVAEGKPKGVVVEVEGGPCVLAALDTAAAIRGLVLRTKSKPDAPIDAAVLVTAGTLTLDECEVVADSEAAVRVRNDGARVVLKACSVVGGRYGLAVSDGGFASLDRGEVSGSSAVGIEVTGAGSVVEAKGSHVHGHTDFAIRLAEHGTGRFDDVRVERSGETQVLAIDGASVTLRRVVVRGGKGYGVLFRGGVKATFEGCELVENGRSGLGAYDEGTSVKWRGGKLSKNGGSGALVDEKASATFEDGEADDNEYVGIEYRGEASGSIRRMLLRRQVRGAGVTVHQRCTVKLETVELSHNGSDGLTVFDEATVDARRCKLHHNKGNGAFVEKKGTISLADTDVYANGAEGLFASGGELTANRCAVYDNKTVGVSVGASGRATLEECTVRSNGGVGIQVEDGEVFVNASKVLDGKSWALHFAKGGTGRVAATEISGHAGGGVSVDEGANPTLLDCKIRKNAGAGIKVALGGRATIERCDLTGSPMPWEVVEPLAVQRKGNKPNK